MKSKEEWIKYCVWKYLDVDLPEERLKVWVNALGQYDNDVIQLGFERYIRERTNSPADEPISDTEYYCYCFQDMKKEKEEKESNMDIPF